MRELIKQLGTALQEAEAHLDYCGYGDAWERSCAEELQQILAEALQAYRKFNEQEEKS